MMWWSLDSHQFETIPLKKSLQITNDSVALDHSMPGIQIKKYLFSK